MLQDRRIVRDLAIAMVLHTDMQHHFHTVTKFQLRHGLAVQWHKDFSDITLVMQMAIKVYGLGVNGACHKCLETCSDSQKNTQIRGFSYLLFQTPSSVEHASQDIGKLQSSQRCR